MPNPRVRSRRVVSGHPFAEEHQQDALASLWQAMERRHPQRRFRRPGRKGKHIEFLGRCVDRDSARIWLMREGDAYWLMSEFGFLHGIDRYWERDEIEPGDPGGWG